MWEVRTSICRLWLNIVIFLFVLKIPYLLLIGYISSIRWWSWSLPHRCIDGESCSGWWWRLLLTLGTKCYFCQRWGVLQQSSELYLDGHLCILYSWVFQVDFNVICHFCGVFLNIFPQVSFLQVLLLIRQMEHSNTQSVRIFIWTYFQKEKKMDCNNTCCH